MNMPFSIARFLHQQGIGVFDEVNGTNNSEHNIFIGIMPDGANVPRDVILLNQYAGSQPLLKALDQVQRPGLQIKCRAQYYDDAHQKAEQINRLLDQYSGEIDGLYFDEIRAIQSPFFLEQDGNERIIFCQNFHTAIRE